MPHLPDGSTGITHLAIGYSEAALLYRVLFSSELIFKDHCGQCSRTAERLDYLELEISDYLLAVAQNPEHIEVIRRGKTSHIALPQLCAAEEANRPG